MSNVGDGSSPRRSDGGIVFGRGGDKTWVGEYDRGWRICVAGSWVSGYYASKETAERASGLSAAELQQLFPIWTRDGEDRPVTWDDLDRVESARTARPLQGFACGVGVLIVVGLGVAGTLAAPAGWPDFISVGLGAGALFAGGWLLATFCREVGLRVGGTGSALAAETPSRKLRPRVILDLARQGGVPSGVAIVIVVIAVTVFVVGVVLGILSL